MTLHLIEWQKIKAIPLLGINEIALKRRDTRILSSLSRPLMSLMKSTDWRYCLIEKKTRPKPVRGYSSDEKSNYTAAALIGMKAIAMLFMRRYRVAMAVDQFHVANNYRGYADNARKQEMQVLKNILSDEEYAERKAVT